MGVEDAAMGDVGKKCELTVAEVGDEEAATVASNCPRPPLYIHTLNSELCVHVF